MPVGRPPFPTLAEITQLAARVNAKREELEADMQAIANDARHAGCLVVTHFPEHLDLSWIQCCSIPTRDCENGHKKKGPQR